MRKSLLVTCLGFLLFMIQDQAMAQLYGTNTFEFQYGNLPYEENRDLTTSYDQLDLYFDQGNLSLYGRTEYFLTPFRERNYFSLTQKRLQYEDEQFNIRIGNFYETIGRGLLLRSYEIPGSVFEDSFYRTRYAFNRDIEGLSFGFSNDFVEATVIRGRPLFNPLPPNIEPDSLRRPELIEAVESHFFLSDDISIGGAFMRLHEDGQTDYSEYGSLMLNSELPLNLQLTSEYAFATDTDLFAFNQKGSYGFYAGLNYFYDTFGASLEYKNYNRFTLGSGFNNPPSLIKEHTYPVLNRSTHVLSTADESGIQLEVFYTFAGGHTITANYTTAKNEVVNRFDYKEYFIEGNYNVNDLLTLKSFLDYANDELKGEQDRVSAGFILDKIFDYTWSLTLDLQFQRFDRPFNPNTSENYYASLAVNYIPDLTVSAVFEASTDPNLTDDPRTLPTETAIRTWMGGNVRYKINSVHTLDIFAGKRRGGPACTSGICYEILDFEGVEVRFSTRF
ncbi:DUF6029 family protein [Aliifodinibius sp. S!AR15-10]|uniref:DUF6029 family protein n=1 Tax=Aliifodinibius sp. S!AR15-10 TaxID=2950437 RepID=UPI0028546AEF|nr:DUF6029 family protein [Aliifodinibius sp. S!AR15-10]MDR8390141.1 DUF6029 family protein [Aliifodinibius sp. S!AR15-10]